MLWDGKNGFPLLSRRNGRGVLSVRDSGNEKKTGQPSCREAVYPPLLRSGKNGFPLLIWRNGWGALSVLDSVQRKKTGQTSCRERTCRRGGTSSLTVGWEKQLSVADSAQWAGCVIRVGFGQRKKRQDSRHAGSVLVAVAAHRPLMWGREKRLSSYLIWCAGGMWTAPRRA